MKKKFIFIVLATVVYSFSSCQNDTEEILQSVVPSELNSSLKSDLFTEKITQKGSYLEFKDGESFF